MAAGWMGLGLLTAILAVAYALSAGFGLAAALLVYSGAGASVMLAALLSAAMFDDVDVDNTMPVGHD